MLRIRLFGDPVLRKPAEEIETVDDEVRGLAAEMVETMHGASGIGLAAPQVGVMRRLLVMLPMKDFDDREAEPIVMVNPSVEHRSKERSTFEEGCLSLPGIQEQVTRPREVECAFLDLEGRQQTIRFSGLASHIVQHEIDHLDGLLLIDRISAVRRTLLKKKLAQIRERARQDPND